VVFFVHGSSVTSRVFDLTVPARANIPSMNEFARYGFDCWTMDHENYGKSGRTSGNADIASGVEDLKVAAEVITKETGQKKFHFVGESSGALRAGGLCHGGARPRRPPGVRRLHLQGRGLADADKTRLSSWPISVRTTCASAIAT
jgi:hypothetical protein